MSRQFDITLSNSQRISGEAKAGKKMIIFSHGFDVRRDSNGLFKDIVNNLPEDYGYVIFDYHVYEGIEENLRPLSEQARVLKEVVKWTKHEFKPLTINLIAHSMGCTIASYAQEKIFDQILYLAPAMRSGSRLRTFFTSRPTAKHHGDHWEVSRRSGKITRINDRFFEEFEAVDPPILMMKYATKKPINIIFAKQDEFITEDSFDIFKSTTSINVRGINGDHNFNAPARQNLLNLINKTITFKESRI